MKKIRFTNPHRQKHFDFFNNMDQPHFSLCANMEIHVLLDFIKKEALSFTTTMVYLIARTANEIPQFKQRIRGSEIVEHDFVQPSFTVNTAINDVFSFCTVEYDADFTIFAKRASEEIERMRTNPSFEDEEGKDDYLFLSAIPWVSFTNLHHAMHYSPVDSVPRIAWGKYFKEQDKTKMPLSVQAHHALVDGIHMGRYFQAFQELANHPLQLFS